MGLQDKIKQISEDEIEVEHTEISKYTRAEIEAHLSILRDNVANYETQIEELEKLLAAFKKD